MPTMRGPKEYGTLPDVSFRRFETEVESRDNSPISAAPGENDGRPLLVQSPLSTPALVYIAFLFPALAGFLFGYDIGSTSGALEALRLEPTAASLKNDVLDGIAHSASLFGAVFGTLLVCGRQPILLSV